LHPSDLPLCKGPAPIPWSIAKGLDQAMITAFIINERIDDGNYIYKSSGIDIVDKRGVPKTANKIYHELMNNQVKQTIDALFGTLNSDGNFINLTRDDPWAWNNGKNLMGIFDQDLQYAPKLTKENTRITKKALGYGERLQRFINGMCWKDHNAWTIVDNKEVKFIEAGVSIPGFIGHEPGELVVKQKVVYIITYTLAGVELLTVKPEGKREMPAIDWINGVRNRRIDYGTVL
jgi:methionyl-tRNA formyltransferase